MKTILILFSIFMLATSCGTSDETPTTPPTASKYQKYAKENEIKIMSFNVRTKTSSDEGINHWDQRKEACVALVKDHKPTIIGFQEAQYGSQWTYLKEQLRADYDGYGVGRTDGKESGETMGILYDRNLVEMIDCGTFWLSETPEKVSYGWDAACRRVCSWGYFKDKQTKKKFWFFNTHMDHKGKTARVEGAKLVISKIKQMCGNKANVILTGDFNVPQDSEPYLQILSDGRLVDAYESAEVCYAPTGTFNSFKVANHTTKRIDHVFVSKGVKVERYGILTYHYWSDETGEKSSLTDAPHEISANKKSVHLHSDHYPVIATIGWE